MVDSIKGGCGKTTFSIMLAQFLQNTNKTKGIEDRVCLLDFDFLGTGLAHLFFAESLKKFVPDYEYITKIIRGFDVGDKQYLYDCKIVDTPFLVGFGDPNYRKKEAYYISSKLNYTPIIHYGIFRDGIRRMLKDSLESQIDKPVESVVLDMSPGVDAYSQVVKDCLFDKRHNTFLDSDDKKYYFLMTGIDNSQLYAAANYFQEFMYGEDNSMDRLFIVLNDWTNIAVGDESTLVVLYKAWIRKFEMHVRVPDINKEKIFFLIPHCFSNYWNCVHRGDALIDAKESDAIFLETPFRYWKKWGEDNLNLVKGPECIEVRDPNEHVTIRGALLKCLKE